MANGSYLIKALIGAGVLIGVLSFSGCSTFERNEWQKPDQVLDTLALREGDLVADLGSGEGYFTFRLADPVRPDGLIYASDIDTDNLADIKARATSEGYERIRTVAASPRDPGLPEPVDLVFLCNVFHHLSDRVDYFRNVQRYLKPDARVAIIELDELPWWGNLIFWRHVTPADDIRREMEQAGYELYASHDFLPYQNFLIFKVSRG